MCILSPLRIFDRKRLHITMLQNSHGSQSGAAKRFLDRCIGSNDTVRTKQTGSFHSIILLCTGTVQHSTYTVSVVSFVVNWARRGIRSPAFNAPRKTLRLQSFVC